jgi:hypothetical protein
MNATRLEYHSTVDRQLNLFSDKLPKKPYCSDDPNAFGLHITSKQKALTRRYIQHNGPTHKFWLVYDVDRDTAAVDWYDRGAPTPNFITKTPETGKAHLIYGLEVSVKVGEAARAAPLRFAGAVDNGLRDLLDADIGYCGLVTKNPLHPDWTVQVPKMTLYDLTELAEYIDVSKYSDRRRKLPEYGIGRNCTVFERLSQWAYKAIRQGWPRYEQWLEAVRDRAIGLNGQLDTPMQRNECLQIAKSVAKWVYARFSADGFSQWQAKTGRKGGLAKGRAFEDKAASARLMRATGMTTRAIAAQLSCSPQSVLNWLSK